MLDFKNQFVKKILHHFALAKKLFSTFVNIKIDLSSVGFYLKNLAFVKSGNQTKNPPLPEGFLENFYS